MHHADAAMLAVPKLLVVSHCVHFTSFAIRMHAFELADTVLVIVAAQHRPYCDKTFL